MRPVISFLLISAAVFLTTCKKPLVEPTHNCSYSVQDINVNHPKAKKLQEVMNVYIKRGMPGVSLLIEDENGKWTGAAGKADIEKNIAMQPCHIGKTASLTKFFMASLAFKLSEEGYFEIDDKISQYIDKDIIRKIKYADEVTIRMLLAHQTGIYDVITDGGFYLQVLNNPGKEWTQEQLLEYVYGKDPEFRPGESVGYSNTNTLLLSIVIDKAAGKHHSTVLREKILDPLGLSSTYYHRHETPPANMITQGYFDLYNNNTIINVSNLHTGNGNGYNGIYSTVGDLHKFIKALLVEKTVISDSSIAQMKVFHTREESNRLLGAACLKILFTANQMNTLLATGAVILPIQPTCFIFLRKADRLPCL